MIKDIAAILGISVMWLICTFLDLLILTALIYAVGHWIFHVW